MKISKDILEYAQNYSLTRTWIEIVEVLLEIWDKTPFIYPSVWICYNKTLQLNALHEKIEEEKKIKSWFKNYSKQINQMFSDICLCCREDRKENKANVPSKELLEQIEQLKLAWNRINKIEQEESAQ